MSKGLMKEERRWIKITKIQNNKKTSPFRAIQGGKFGRCIWKGLEIPPPIPPFSPFSLPALTLPSLLLPPFSAPEPPKNLARQKIVWSESYMSGFCLINRVFAWQTMVESDTKYVWLEWVKPDVFYVWFPGWMQLDLNLCPNPQIPLHFMLHLVHFHLTPRTSIRFLTCEVIDKYCHKLPNQIPFHPFRYGQAKVHSIKVKSFPIPWTWGHWVLLRSRSIPWIWGHWTPHSSQYSGEKLPFKFHKSRGEPSTPWITSLPCALFWFVKSFLVSTWVGKLFSLRAGYVQVCFPRVWFLHFVSFGTIPTPSPTTHMWLCRVWLFWPHHSASVNFLTLSHETSRILCDFEEQLSLDSDVQHALFLSWPNFRVSFYWSNVVQGPWSGFPCKWIWMKQAPIESDLAQTQWVTWNWWNGIWPGQNPMTLNLMKCNLAKHGQCCFASILGIATNFCLRRPWWRFRARTPNVLVAA